MKTKYKIGDIVTLSYHDIGWLGGKPLRLPRIYDVTILDIDQTIGYYRVESSSNFLKSKRLDLDYLESRSSINLKRMREEKLKILLSKL